MPFTEPNRYWPRPDWKEKLRSTGGIGLRFDSWQAQLFLYWAWRATGRRPHRDHLVPSSWTATSFRLENV